MCMCVVCVCLNSAADQSIAELVDSNEAKLITTLQQQVMKGVIDYEQEEHGRDMFVCHAVLCVGGGRLSHRNRLLRMPLLR